MMLTKDECVNCGLPCIGNQCPHHSVTRYYCDECGDEVNPEELYVYEDESQLCKSCLVERVVSQYKTVADS